VKSSFLMMFTNPGSIPLLKAEIKRNYPFLHPSYGRGNFLTFKNTRGEMSWDLDFPTIFAQNIALSWGKCSAEDLAQTLHQLQNKIQNLKPALPVVLDFWSRADLDLPPPPEVAEILRPPPPQHNEYLVLQIAQVEAHEFWTGARLRSATKDGCPADQKGNQIPLPPEAPARSFLKIAQAAAYWGIDFKNGDKVVEIGCAPGGISYFLLQQGAEVWGVDSSRMDPVCRGPRFHHLAYPHQKIRSQDFPPRPDWLVIDINQRPMETLGLWSRLQESWQESLRGHLVHFKLGRDTDLLIPRILKKISQMGFYFWQAKQLPAHGQEFMVWACPERPRTF
jgi:23S rRNA (cytidine2498-2'-O)-methyltransferase